MDLDASTLEPARRVLPELARDLGEDLRRRVDEHPALGHLAESGVGAERRMCHVVQLGERLDARVSRADEDEAELGRVVGMDRRALELQQDAVAERDRVSEVLEADPVLREPGHGKGARRRPEGDDEPLVSDLDRPGQGLDGDGLAARDRDRVIEPRTSSACGHISRSGTTTWRGSSVPEAASGRSGVYSMKFSCDTIVAPLRFSSRAT